MNKVSRSLITRRALVFSVAATFACSRHKAVGYRGYCFVANQGGRSVSAVDLTSFRLRKQIPLDAVPGLVLPHPSQPKAFVLAPETGTVYEIDAATLSVSRRARAGSEAAGMQVSPRNDALWVLYRNPPSLVELPLASLQPGRPIRLPARPDDFDLSRDGRAAIACRDAGIVVLASLSRASV